MAKRTREYIYGMNPAFEVIRAGKRHIYEAFLSQSASGQPRLKNLLRVIKRSNIDFHWEDPDRLTDLAGSRAHQGVVLKTRAYTYQSSALLWDRKRILLLDSVEDPHNVGGILRSAEIFGFDTVFLANKSVPDIYPSVVKVSAGATEFLDIAKDDSAYGYTLEAKKRGFLIIALDEDGNTDISDLNLKPSDKILVVVGGEDLAVSQSILGKADFIISIGQKGRIHSLNVAVAAGIAMYLLQY